MWTNEIKTKMSHFTSHWNWARILLFDLTHKQCNGIIKGWLHCLTSESKGRFLANNILIFGSAWFLVMAQIQYLIFFNNKKKMLTLTPFRTDNISFLPYPTPPFKVYVICISPLICYPLCHTLEMWKLLVILVVISFK